MEEALYWLDGLKNAAKHNGLRWQLGQTLRVAVYPVVVAAKKLGSSLFNAYCVVVRWLRWRR